MANLKDTIVLGNLTVTGKVVASDILVSGTGNEFDTIKVNNIYSNTADAIEFQDSVITNCSLSAPGGIYVNYIENSDGNLELNSSTDIQMSVAESCSINANSLNLTSTNDICFQSATGNQLLLSGNDLIPGSDKSMNLGTSTCAWNNLYTNRIIMPTTIITNTSTTPTIYYNASNTIYPYRTQNSSINGGSGTQCAYTHYGPSGNYKVTIPSLSVTVGNPSSTTHSLSYSFANKSASSTANLSYAYGAEYTYYTGAASTTSISSVTLTYGSTYYFKVTGSAAKYSFNIDSIYLTPLSKTDNQGTISINSPSTTIYAGQTVIGCKSDSAYDIAIGSSGQRYCAIASPTSQWTYVSDKRDKTDIETIQTALSFVKQLTPITYVDNMREYYFNDDGTFNAESHAKGIFKKHRRRAGFLAQDVYKTLINEYKTDNYASIVDYNKYKQDSEEPIDRYSFNGMQLIPFLVKAIQEQQEIIDKLQARIEILEQGDK
jgi:hypothetical protein